jgi:membrane-bound lytic murein transglycosylase D
LRKITYILFSIILFVNSQIEAKEPNSTISFCNEVLPLHEPTVMRYLDQALHRTGNSVMTDIRKNAPQFFNVIDPILVHYQVPADFKYLCIAESAFTKNATSHKGAVGFWQFMPETARAMGLVVNGKIDERQNLRKSTAAACRYFRQLYHELGSWTLVAAAYNAGPTKMKEYLKVNGKRNFYQWSIYSETRKYLYRVVAIKEMMSRPDVYESMLTYKTPLRVFLRNQGTLLGLMEWPISSKIVEVKIKLKNTDILTVSEALVSGFEAFVPVVYKRYLFGVSTDYSLSRMIKEQQETIDTQSGFSCSDELAIQWVTLPFYSRRRLEDYLLPVDPKVTILKKINRRYVEVIV